MNDAEKSSPQNALSESTPSLGTPEESKVLETVSTPKSIVDDPTLNSKRMTGQELWSQGHGEFAYFLHEYMGSMIIFADQKAVAIMAVASALLTLLPRQTSQRLTFILFPPNTPSGWAELMICVFLALAALLALLALLPRSTGKTTGLVYWKGILRAGGFQGYKTKIRSSDDAAILEAILEHCYELAQIAERKYMLVNLAIWVGAIGSIGACLLLLGILKLG